MSASHLFIVVVLTLGLAPGLALSDAPPYDIRVYFHQSNPKPDKPVGAQPVGGDDSCQWANDMECDEPGLGTGACAAGTDYSDCWRLMTNAEDNSCEWANDGECDEPGFGTGACTQGTDLADCGDVSALRFRTDRCATAFDGVCNEPEGGDGTCEARTDRADCIGRERPTAINDHFFGYDDRVLLDRAVFPWNVIGQVNFDAGGACTATLIGVDILITAAHCVYEGGALAWAGIFRTSQGLKGAPLEARVTDFYLDPEWHLLEFTGGEEADGTDWALLRIDTPLGAELGHVGIRGLVDTVGPERALTTELHQAGYSWDTGSNLSGHLGCDIVAVFDDFTMSHECDTTRGDSGSPFMVRDGDEYFVVATDSNFRSNADGPMVYIAVRSERWIPYYADFAAGRLSGLTAEAAKPGKGPEKQDD